MLAYRRRRAVGHFVLAVAARRPERETAPPALLWQRAAIPEAALRQRGAAAVHRHQRAVVRCVRKAAACPWEMETV
jgi:hypothetical protein